jgi:simple sugar transport system permease protein
VSLSKQVRSFFQHIDGNILRLLLAVVVIYVGMSLLLPDLFPTTKNYQSMAFQASEIGILSIAIMLAMLSGGIDLSVVPTANLAGILAGMVLQAMVGADPATGNPIVALVVAILVAVGVGFLAGLFNGILIAVIGMAPILATLGTLLIYRGIGTAISQGSTIFGIDESQVIGNDVLLGIPIPLIILLVIAITMSVLLSRTRFGLQLYLLGTNPTAAKFSGINNRKILIQSYIISGILAAIAGVVILGRTNAANVDFGGSYTLLAILIAVLGSVDPYGGSGSAWGVLLALAALQFLSTGFNMLLRESSGANFFKELAWGALLLIVLLINYFSQKRQMYLASRWVATADAEE